MYASGPVVAKGVAIIGENNARVQAFAARIPGAVTTQTVEGSTGTPLAANATWFNRVRDAEYLVVNIGRDPYRVARGDPVGIYYQLELALAELRDYPLMLSAGPR